MADSADLPGEENGDKAKLEHFSEENGGGKTNGFKNVNVNLDSCSVDNGYHGADADLSPGTSELLEPGTMKKDDSGISIEKMSPLVSARDNTSDGEGNNSATFNDSATFSLCETAPDPTKPWDTLSPDSGSTENKLSPDLSDDLMEDSNNSLENLRDAHEEDVGEIAEAVKLLESSESRRRLRKIRNRLLRRDSDSDSDEDEDDDDDDDDDERKIKEDSSESEEEEDEEEEKREKPKEIWHALFDLRRRELGFSNKTPPSLFRERVQGSLNMVQRLELQYSMVCHDGCVNALNFNRIGTLLASSSDDLNIVLWNWVQNKPALVYDSGHRSNVFQAKFMPYSGDCHVVSCARDGQVRLAELSLTGRCKETKKLAQHKGAAHKLALELDSPHLFLSCGEDAVTFEIDLRDDKPHKLVVTKENDRKVGLYSIHSNPTNSYEFCVGGRDYYIRIYDKRKIAENLENGVLKKFCPHHLVDSTTKANITCACYNYNGTEVLGSYNDEDIYLFDNKHSDGAEYIHRYKGHRNNATVKGVNFYGPRSEFIVSGSDCGHVFLWDKQTENIVQFMRGDEGGVINVLEPHPFAPVLATSGLDHDVKIWSPTAEQGTDLIGLKKNVRRNRKEREQERSEEPDMIDGQMLWLVMHHFRRSARRQLRQEGGDVSSSSENMDSDSEESEEDADRLQCAPS